MPTPQDNTVSMFNEKPAPAPKPVSKLLFILLIVLVLLSVPLVLGFLGRVHPALDGFAHFRVYIAAIMAIGGIILLFTRLRREAAMVVLLALSALSTTVNWSGKTPHTEAASGETSYKLMQINLQQDNPDPKAMLQAIARNKPDIITYQEASEEWQPWLKVLQGSYPYQHQCDNLPAVWGVGILSRRPFAEFSSPVCTANGILATALVNFGGTNVLVSSLHMSWPWPYKQAKQFEMMLPSLQAMQNAHGIPVIIAGDFNATPWSYSIRKIENATDTKHIKSIGATWLTQRLPDSFKKWIGLPIDQVLINQAVSIRKITTDVPSGSDHLPVLLEFSVPMPASEPIEQPEPEPVKI